MPSGVGTETEVTVDGVGKTLLIADSPPVCRKDDTPQYCILNLAGLSVSMKVAYICAHISQLLEVERGHNADERPSTSTHTQV